MCVCVRGGGGLRTAVVNKLFMLHERNLFSFLEILKLYLLNRNIEELVGNCWKASYRTLSYDSLFWQFETKPSSLRSFINQKFETKSRKIKRMNLFSR